MIPKLVLYKFCYHFWCHLSYNLWYICWQHFFVHCLVSFLVPFCLSIINTVDGKYSLNTNNLRESNGPPHISSDRAGEHIRGRKTTLRRGAASYATPLFRYKNNHFCVGDAPFRGKSCGDKLGVPKKSILRNKNNAFSLFRFVSHVSAKTQNRVFQMQCF